MTSSMYHDDDIDCNSTLYHFSRDHNNYYYNSSSNDTSPLPEYSLAPLHVLIPGTVVFFAILPLVLFHFRWFPIGPSPSVLLGSLLMIVTQVVSQNEAYEVLGHKHNLTAVFLLLGMMLLAQYVEREQLLLVILRKMLHHNQTFANYIWRICLLSFLISAFFTNDACCAIFTPLAMKYWESQKRPRLELETLLLAIATSANIGSVSTVFGNPQMALIAAKTSTKAYEESQLDMLSCVVYLFPAAIIVQISNTLFLILHLKLRTRRNDRETTSQSEQEMVGLAAGISSKDGHHSSKEEEMHEIPENRSIKVEAQAQELVMDRNQNNMDENNDSYKGMAGDLTQMSSISYRPSALNATAKSTSQTNSLLVNMKLDDTDEQHDHQQQGTLPSNQDMDEYGLELWHKGGVYKSVSALSAADFLPPDTGLSQLNGDNLAGMGSQCSLFTAGYSKAFPIVLLILLLTVIVLFLASSKAVVFDIGFVPMGAAILALTADAVLNRRSGLIIIKRVDWSIILLFFGLFVWIHGFNNTKIPHCLWHYLGLDDSTYVAAKDVAILTCFVVVGSNIFSNVPLTLLLLDQLQPCQPQKALALFLAWISTISGNLTLFGSVANIIVVQKGMQTVNYRLTFWQYFIFGFPTTILHTILGLCIISGLLLIP